MSKVKITEEEIKKLENQKPEEILGWAFDRFSPNIALSSSFQCEESVLIDMLSKLRGNKFRIFTLDTGRLNEETYEVMDRMRQQYGIKIESQFPEKKDVQKLETEKGFYSFRDSVENRKECCHIRKVVPLGNFLKGLSAWVTGLRREQSLTRTDIPKIEKDIPNPGMFKFNPIVDWTSDQVWDYIKKNKVPYNKLHDAGYPSIGCAPCTRAVKPGEGVRSGRWWWENPDHKECGIHVHKKS